MKSNRKPFEKRGYYRKSDEPCPESGISTDHRSIWKKPGKKSNGIMMVIRSSDGVLTHHTYCGKCNQWRFEGERPHTSGKHDLFLLNEPCLPPDHPAFILMSIVEEKMSAMNFANAGVHDQDEEPPSEEEEEEEEDDEAAVVGDEIVDDEAEESEEEYEFEWDGRDEIVEAVRETEQIVESATRRIPLRNVSNSTAASSCSGRKTSTTATSYKSESDYSPSSESDNSEDEYVAQPARKRSAPVKSKKASKRTKK